MLKQKTRNMSDAVRVNAQNVAAKSCAFVLQHSMLANLRYVKGTT